ncbi:hypothetical protein GOBAR_AA22668 [Gossypium barbadense]|uniref:Uncharacterized protein n=1 Tax=Gossypium barbadense TaxID=3634 RepID=A0A2P5X3S8_GOSBA|nr:hypothetical protein GOBAR_AA22668 [Gossypium barbadense]
MDVGALMERAQGVDNEVDTRVQVGGKKPVNSERKLTSLVLPSNPKTLMESAIPGDLTPLTQEPEPKPPDLFYSLEPDPKPLDHIEELNGEEEEDTEKVAGPLARDKA